MTGSNNVEDITARTTLLQSMNRNTRFARCKMSYKINYLLAVINFLIVILAIGSAGLTASTLDWVTSGHSTDVYLMNINKISTTDLPDSLAISELPLGLQTVGSRLIVATSVICALSGALTIFFIVKQSLKSIQPYGTTSKDSSGRLLVTAGILATSAVMTVSVLIYTWNQYYQMPNLVIYSQTVVGKVYQRTWYTPEAWAQRLSRIIASQDDASTIQARYIIASTGRILLAPMAGLQIVALIGLFAVRERTNKPAAVSGSTGNTDLELESAYAATKASQVTESVAPVDPVHQYGFRQPAPERPKGPSIKSPAAWTFTPQH